MPEGCEIKLLAESWDLIFKSQPQPKCVRWIGHSGIWLSRPDEYLPIQGKTFTGASQKGKLLIFHFSDGSYLTSGMGLTGYWDLYRDKYTCLQIVMEGDWSAYFSDKLRFGTVKYYPNLTSLQKKLDTIGPDVLVPSTDLGTFISRIRKKPKLTISSALMDQSLVSGIGNYIKTDSLYLSRIHPLCPVAKLTDSDLTRLWEAVRRVILSGYFGVNTFDVIGDSSRRELRIEYFGLAMKDLYLQKKGSGGSYGEYDTFVYGKNIDPEGNQVETLKTPDGRTTYWVPSLQPLC